MTTRCAPIGRRLGVSGHQDVHGTRIDCTYRVHGQVAYLAGMSVKDDGYWSQMWLPGDTVLARTSFTIR